MDGKVSINIRNIERISLPIGEMLGCKLCGRWDIKKYKNGNKQLFNVFDLPKDDNFYPVDFSVKFSQIKNDELGFITGYKVQFHNAPSRFYEDTKLTEDIKKRISKIVFMWMEDFTSLPD